MKTRGKLLILSATAIVAISFFAIKKAREPKRWQLTADDIAKIKAAEGPPTNGLPRNYNLLKTVRAADLSPAERAALEKNFNERYKPAAEKWIAAYENRVPFRTDDFTLDRFVERFGTKPSAYAYTFVWDGITLTIQDSDGNAKVFYMMTKKGARDLNESPPPGTQPNPATPLQREEVARMVKADVGVEFKLNEVLLRPTGLGTAMSGGAFVDIGPRGGDPNIGPCKLSMVFAPDGTLCYYMRDPFF